MILNKLQVIAIAALFSCYLGIAQEAFTQVTPTGINNFFYPALDWGDINGDGFNDVVISGGIDTSGDLSADTSQISIFTNNNNGTFTELSTPNIYGLHLGDVKFMDIDNDGDLDLLTTGQNYNDIYNYYLKIYLNDNSQFTETQSMDGVIFASIDAGDYDNDGDLDLLISGAFQAHDGASTITKIFDNNNGVFTESSVTVPAVQNGKAAFGDLDSDLDLDIIIMGNDINYSPIFKTYTNNLGSYTEHQVLPAMSDGWFDLGDFDSDGDLDVAIMGYDENYDYASKIFSNTNGTFSEHAVLTGLGNFGATKPIAWGDYDNDGDLDLVISGSDDDYNDVTHLYQNTNNVFTLIDEGLVNLGGSASLGWSDIDNDNDLDIIISGFNYDENNEYTSFTVLHENTTSISNLKPNAPTNLTNTVNESGITTFAWDAPSDDLTQSPGLFYWLSVGTTSNGSEIASYRIDGTSWSIKGLDPNTNYYWSVQAVDAAFVFSDKATMESLSIEGYGLDSTIRVYPVPSKGKNITVALPQVFQGSKELNIEIYSTLGQLVLAITLEHTTTLNLSQLNNGTYIIKIVGDSFQTTKKIILL
ncbi:MAG: FG-GAP-like repeat-containing protein [Xanthomarina gelatinilytica]|uniref:FG-GAP-like repeat-containing protein n=1 Tax=Xanthomarina gelatinilytica TaxID=1137281 RepID=UPI003A85FBDD